MPNGKDQKDNVAEEEEAGIYRVDTVPPPAGESDAYSAPTRVGPMAASVVQEMLVAAERKAAELSGRAATAAKSASPAVKDGAASDVVVPKSGPPKAPPRAPTPPVVAAPRPAPPVNAPKPAPVEEVVLSSDELVNELNEAAGVLPRLYEDTDDDDHAETLLSKNAKPPAVAPSTGSTVTRENTERLPAATVAAAVHRVDAHAPTLLALPHAPPLVPSSAPAPVVRGPLAGVSFLLVVVVGVGLTIFMIGLILFFFDG
jgi:hypothetical protein